MWLSLGGKSFDFISPVGLSLLAMGIIGGIALILVESKSANPSVSVRMFRKPRFRTTFLVQIFLVAYSSCAAAFGIVYVQQVMRDSSLASSTVTMPQTIVQAVMGFFVGSYIGKNFKNRFRPFAVLALAVYTIAMAMFSSLQPSSSMVVIYIATALGGIGQSITQSTYAAFFQTELKPEEISGAQGMYQFGSSGGSCIFMAIGSLVLNAGFTLNHIFMLGTAFCAVALVIGLIGFRFPKTETPE
jgi:MFS family permease